MNILVIGNGFDLAHGYPTKYTDFLKFVESIRQPIKEKNNQDSVRIDRKNTDWSIKDNIPRADRWKDLLDDNIWIDYFIENPMYQKENWVDFESEISEVIKSIEQDMRGKDFYGQIEELSNKYLEKHYLYKTGKDYETLFVGENGERDGKQQVTYKDLRDKLNNDLDRLIGALELYLVSYVEIFPCNILSPDIRDLCFDAILSFNYTDTYNKLYHPKRHLDYDYIHGKAKSDNTISTNNMVLGMDEYLPDGRRDSDLEFIAFKKFYQRIYKGTSCKYKEWIDDINSDAPIKNKEFAIDENGYRYIKEVDATYHNLYIFGHSLDVTDKDVLREFILNDKVKTFIYYNKIYDSHMDDDNGRRSKGEKIINLVKLIGQDELIRRTSGSKKMIEFRLQQDMLYYGWEKSW